MTSRLRRTILLLGMTILFILFMSIDVLSAETTMNTEEHDQQVEMSPVKNSLEEDLKDDPRFFFTQSQLQGTVNELINVSFSSDQEVSEVQVFLPEEATIVKEQLPEGTSVVKGEQPREWLIQSEHAKNTFVIPLLFDKDGSYELSVEETIAYLEIEISDKNNKIIDDYLLSEAGESDNSPRNQENSNMKENNTIRSSELDQILMVFGTQGDLISGDSNFHYSDIARLSISDNSTLVREGNFLIRVTNVGYFSGKKLDVLVSGISSSRISISNNSSLLISPNSSSSFTDNYTITAVYAESNEVVDANILFHQSNFYRYTSYINLESIFRIAVSQSKKNLVSLNNNQVVFHSRSGFPNNNYTGDIILSNGALIRTAASSLNLANRYSLFSRNFTIPNQNFEGKVQINHINIDNSEILHAETISGDIGTSYVTTPMDDENYDLVSSSDNSSGTFKDEDQIVDFYYQLRKVTPVDPVDPEVEIDPENKPTLPENQGQLSIDFVSSFNFGSQAISVHDQTYYAQPQRLLNEDGMANETEERPNYVQISDRRSESDRNGWELAVTQQEQFKGKENQALNGASLTLSNQQVVTAQGGTASGMQTVPCELIPGNRRTLLKAQGNEGIGTWIYRFGDAETAKESVALHIPKGANPEATSYSTTLTWELSAVPEN
ncbi:hypothetical protein IGJ16_002836 [Enterococcus pernyi]